MSIKTYNRARAEVYHAVRASQDGGAIGKFFDGAYEPKDDELTRIELYARPSIGDLLNYLLVKVIAQVDENAGSDELAHDLSYAARQLEAAAEAVRNIATA